MECRIMNRFAFAYDVYPANPHGGYLAPVRVEVCAPSERVAVKKLSADCEGSLIKVRAEQPVPVLD
jgi:hypothetical protein